MRRAFVVAIAGGIAAACVAANACSLGLDESKIDAGPLDAAVVASEDAPAPPVVDSAPDVAAPAEASAPGCVLDTDCTSTNACRVGKCTNGSCAFSVCPTGTCQGSSCTVASACSAPTTYGFHSSSIAVTAGAVGCNGNAAVCVAAAYPFVFVGTTEGIVAYPVNDPSNSTPTTLPVLGVPFVPLAMTSMGSRVYFVGAVVGGGPSWRVPLAWIDVPTDPLATTLQATSAFDTLTEPAIAQAWAGTDGALFLADEDATNFFPLAEIAAPLKDGDALSFFPSPGIPVNAAPVTPSGDRIVVARTDPNAFTAYFSLETGAATPNAQNAGEQSMLASIGPTAQQGAFAQGTDGSVLWNTASIVIVDGGTELATTRLAWLLAGSTATTFDATAHLDVELYSPPQPPGTPLVGPVAWIDANTALVLAAAPEALAQTSVQVAVKTPSPALAQGRRTVVPVGVANVGATSSNGFGYVLEADPSGSLELHVFAPGCAQ